MNTEKLIKEYNSIITDQEKVINACTESIRELRRKNLSTKDYNDLTVDYVTDRKIAETKRQSYIQFISDLECLND